MNLNCTNIVDDQFLFIVLPSELPDAHLDEILEGSIHVDVLVLQLAATGPKFHLLYKPEDSHMMRMMKEERGQGRGIGSI